MAQHDHIYNYIKKNYKNSFIIGLNIKDKIYIDNFAIKSSELTGYITDGNYINKFYFTDNKVSHNTSICFELLNTVGFIIQIHCHFDLKNYLIYNESFNRFEPIDKFYVCVYNDNYTIDRMMPLLQLAPSEFNKSINYCKLFNYKYTLTTSLCSKISLCYNEFLFDPCVPAIKIHCINNVVNIPLWLKCLFDEPNPVFIINNNFGVASYHDINAASFKLIIRWMCQLVMRNKMPDAEELINEQLDIDQWLHICDYFNISVMMHYLQLIKNLLNE